MGFKFEKLEVWKISLALATEIHYMAQTFPKDELFSLTHQIKKAADSVTLNIAEGSTGQSNPEQKQFLRYANRSAIEVIGCLYLAKNRKYINEELFQKFYIDYENLIIKIQAFIKKI